jgi:hypothetical protein
MPDKRSATGRQRKRSSRPWENQTCNKQLKGAQMPINPQILNNLATAGSHIVIDAVTANQQEIINVVNLWALHTGSVTIRNASQIPPVQAVNIANILKSRVTFEE